MAMILDAELASFPKFHDPERHNTEPSLTGCRPANEVPTALQFSNPALNLDHPLLYFLIVQHLLAMITVVDGHFPCDSTYK